MNGGFRLFLSTDVNPDFYSVAGAFAQLRIPALESISQGPPLSRDAGIGRVSSYPRPCFHVLATFSTPRLAI